MTVTSSEMASTSSSLCVIMMIVLPCSFIRRRMAKNSSTSCGESTAVGSSKISSSALRYKRFQQLDTLLLPDREVFDKGVRIDVEL